jgi:phospholipid/cholesterol/gamma-HCH transport system permease protein
MVLGLQGYYTLTKFGSDALLGPMVALALIRELGPVLSALMVTGRAGSAMTAEIGIMRNTEQIDALELMGLNPFRYLVVPKLLAGIIGLPLLCSIFNVVGIFGGYLVGVKLLGLSEGTYFSEIGNYVDMEDILGGIYKSLSEFWSSGSAAIRVTTRDLELRA